MRISVTQYTHTLELLVLFENTATIPYSYLQIYPVTPHLRIDHTTVLPFLIVEKLELKTLANCEHAENIAS